MTIHDLERASLFLDGKGGVQVVPNGPDLYTRVKADTTLGDTMVTLGVGSGKSSSHWEMHPAGEEILVILSGSRVIHFEHPDGRRETLNARAGEAVIVPRGVWHKTEAPEGSRILFITYGRGTTHKSAS